jgi:hypothetical protein
MRELQIQQITECTEYRRNWKEQIDRISSDMTEKQIFKYQPKLKRTLGRPLK